ncbi:MAG: hypothetical protein AAGK00_16525 [Pseudomonadota bacterium]
MSERPQRLPYPGLRAFDREEADLFFGRDGAVNEMVDKLGVTGFLAVIGASGTGKSSLVRTGLLDALELGLHPKGSDWQFAVFMPGGQPITNLARALVKAAAEHHGREPVADTGDPDGDIARMEGLLRRGPRAVLEWLDDAEIREETQVLLLVDQFEELFRFDTYADREDAEAFVNLLISSSTEPDSRIHVVITMRSEFLGACSLIPRLAETLNRGNYLTPRMSRRECEMAIIGPARIVGADVDEALTNRLLNDLTTFAPWGREANTTQLVDLTRRADQLPVMQHLLNRMWQQSKSGDDGKVTLTLDDYKALGGLRGALNAHGDEVLANFEGDDLQLAERMFRALVKGQNPAAALRRPLSLSGLAEEIDANEGKVLELIAPFRASDCNFLRPGVPEVVKSDTVIDISHESLIRQWGKMSTWVEAEARAGSLWERLEAYWRRNDRGEGDLMSGRTLSNLSNWWQEEQPTPEWAARYIWIPDSESKALTSPDDLKQRLRDKYAAVEGYLRESEDAELQAEEAKRLAEEERLRREREAEEARLQVLEERRQERERRRKTITIASAAIAILSIAAFGAAFYGYQKTTETLAQQEEINRQQTARLEAERQQQEMRDQQKTLFAEQVQGVVRQTTDALERELGSPTQSKRATIELGEKLLAGLRDYELDQAGFNENLMVFLTKSVTVRLGSGLVADAEAHAGQLEELLEASATAEDWQPSMDKAVEADIALARFARMQARFADAHQLIDRAEDRMADTQGQYGFHSGLTAQLLYERAMVHFAKREIGAHLALHGQLQDLRQPVLTWLVWPEARSLSNPEGDEALRVARLKRTIFLTSIESGLAALVALEMVDAHARDEHDPVSLLVDVERLVDRMRQEFGRDDPAARAVAVRLSLAKARAQRVFDEFLDPDLRAMNAAVEMAEGLVDYDSRSLSHVNHLAHVLILRGRYALEAGLRSQTEQDIKDARTLLHWMLANHTDLRMLTEIAAALEHLDWDFHNRSGAAEQSHRTAHRMDVRVRHAVAAGGLDAVLHAEPKVRAAVARLGITGVDRLDGPALDDLFRDVERMYPVTGEIHPDDLYHALKMRQLVYDGILARPATDIGPDRWFKFHDDAMRELRILHETAPDLRTWRERLMTRASDNWDQYWTQGDVDRARDSLTLALVMAVPLFLESEGLEVDRQLYFDTAIEVATLLVQTLPNTPDPTAALAALEDFTLKLLSADLKVVAGTGAFTTLATAIQTIKGGSAADLDPEAIELLDIMARSVGTAASGLGLPGGVQGPTQPEESRAKQSAPTDANLGDSSPPNPEDAPRQVEDIPGTEVEQEPQQSPNRPVKPARSRGTCAEGLWQFDPLYQGSWRTLDESACQDMLSTLQQSVAAELLPQVELIRVTPVNFFDGGELVEVQLQDPNAVAGRQYRLKTYMIVDGQPTFLNGRIGRILEMQGRAEFLADTPERAASFLRFFMTYVNGPDGAFQIVESVHQLAWTADATPGALAEARAAMRPMQVWEESPDVWGATASVHYGGLIYHADLTLTRAGEVKMSNDVPVTGELPVALVRVLERDQGRGVRAVGLAEPQTDRTVVQPIIFVQELMDSGGTVITSFEQEMVASVRASYRLQHARGERIRAQYVALARDPRVLGGHPSEAEVLSDVALMLARQGDMLADAVVLAERAVDIQNRDPGYATTYGLTLFKNGRHVDAIRELTRVTEDLGPRFKDPWVYLGQAYLAVGDLDRAEAAILAAADLGSLNALDAGDLDLLAEFTLEQIRQQRQN